MKKNNFIVKLVAGLLVIAMIFPIIFSFLATWK